MAEVKEKSPLRRRGLGFAVAASLMAAPAFSEEGSQPRNNLDCTTERQKLSQLAQDQADLNRRCVIEKKTYTMGETPRGRISYSLNVPVSAECKLEQGQIYRRIIDQTIKSNEACRGDKVAAK